MTAPTVGSRVGVDSALKALEWWRDAVVYQIYPRSFADADGDGVGDFGGMAMRLPYLAELGVDAVWISPFYRSPQRDGGYDVEDYTAVDPVFGTLDDFDLFLERAHALGLRVIVDIVPNHSASTHPWFREALAAAPDSEERRRYHFHRGRGVAGELPPNNWLSVFGGCAWERVEDGDWYLHTFDISQPDFNWSNSDVADMFDQVLRFWLDRGVDGFRVDVAHGLVKQAGLPDTTHIRDLTATGGDLGPMWDQDEVHDVYRRWRTVLDEYEPVRILVAEAWVSPAERMAAYVRGDEMNQSFNFPFLMAGWSASRLQKAIDESLYANGTVHAPSTWVISNHDVVRAASRLGQADPTGWSSGIGAHDEQPDAELGLRRARALALLSLALPGSAYIYQGDELGLPEHTTLADHKRKDPSFWRTGGKTVGRDGCRIPMPWERDAPALGFNSTGETWLPQPSTYAQYAVDIQGETHGSTLNLYRQALRLRREHLLGSQTLSWHLGQEGVLDATIGPVRVIANLGAAEFRLPDGYRVLLSSDTDPIDRTIAPDSAVWLTVR